VSLDSKPVKINCALNNVKVNLEIDTGSFISTLSKTDLKDLRNYKIVNTTKRAKGYGNSVIKFVGETTLDVKFNNKRVTHTFLIVDSQQVSLLGRDLCKKLNIKIAFPAKQGNFAVNSVIGNDVLSKYSNYLSDNFQSNVNHKVSLDINPETRPIFCKARSVPLKYKELVKAELGRLEKLGIISKSFRSDWACPSVNVLKSDGTIRVCGDYSLTINKCMDTVQYPLPSVEEVIMKLGNSKVFSKIDLKNAFLQLPLDDKSKQYTTINTSEGLMVYNFLPFGVASSPALFQSFMCQVLSGVNNIIIYQDDILVMTASKEEHDAILDEVLGRLMNAGLKLNTKKCAFYVSSVNYLGHIFDSDGIHTHSDKLRAITDAPDPVNVGEVQSFIGLCNFYRRFIPNFSQTFSPLYKLLQKGVKFQWKDEHRKCFNLVKNLFKSDIVLKPFDPSLPTALESDASAIGIGACLMQLHPDGWLPVQFASRSLNDSERDYSNIEREALSVIYGCEKFRYFLLGLRFTIKNDHKPLEQLFGGKCRLSKTALARVKRWAIRLAHYNYNFEYIKGKDNVNSDFLSRLPLRETVPINEPYELVFVIESLNSLPITCSDIQKYTDEESDLRQVKEFIKSGFPNKVKDSINSFKSVSDRLSIMKGCIMYNNRVFVPEQLRAKVMEQFHDGHPGINAMKQIVRSLIWYPGIDADVVRTVQNCKVCLAVRNKPSQKCYTEWPKADRSWGRLHVDHFFFENKVFFVVIDSLTKYIECEVVSSTSSNDTIEALTVIFSRNGLPDTVVSDNATSFTSCEFREFLTRNCIHHITPPPYSPASNGQAERAVQVIKNLLKKNSTGSLKVRLANSLLYYRNVPHSTSNVSPSIALNGRKYVTIKERINPSFVPSVKSKDKSFQSFGEGDLVYALNLREGAKWLEATVVDKLGVNIYNVMLKDHEVIWKRHASQLLQRTAVRESPVTLHRETQPTRNEFDVNSHIQFPPLNSHHQPSKANPIIVTSEQNAISYEPVLDQIPADLPDSPNPYSHDTNGTPTENIRPDLGADVNVRRSTRDRKPTNRYIENC